MATWRFLFVSTYPPNPGGIAGFTRDLVQAVADGATGTVSQLISSHSASPSSTGPGTTGPGTTGPGTTGPGTTGIHTAQHPGLMEFLAESLPSYASPRTPSGSAAHGIHDTPSLAGLGTTTVPTSANSPVAVADVAALEASWGSTWSGANSSSSRDDPRVVMTADPRREGDLLRLAQEINASPYDTVCVQHDFTLFPSDVAPELMSFFRACRRPKVVTFHSVPAAPDLNIRQTLRTLAELSFACVVMTRRAAEILQRQYGVDSARITLIPHGTPAIRFGHRPTIRHELHLDGRRVITSFGLLSRNKGIEYLIDAMDRVSSQHPDALCLVIGRTAPETVALEGEAYREELSTRVARLRRADSVRFVNRFLPTNEVCAYLQASDLVVTPYLNPDQTTSGTLAYGLAAGKAIVSTPYLHAREALADERGLLVPFRDASSLAGALTGLLSNPYMAETLERRAYQYARRTQWSVVGRHYLELLAEAGLTLRLVAVPQSGRTISGSGSGRYRVYRTGDVSQPQDTPQRARPRFPETPPHQSLPHQSLPHESPPHQTQTTGLSTPPHSDLGGDSRVLPMLHLPRSSTRSNLSPARATAVGGLGSSLGSSSASFELPAASLTEQSSEGPAAPPTTTSGTSFPAGSIERSDSSKTKLF